MMAELAFTPELLRGKNHITAERVTRIERETDQLSDEVALPPHFILPGDSASGAMLDVARTVVRRAERRPSGSGTTGRSKTSRCWRT